MKLVSALLLVIGLVSGVGAQSHHKVSHHTTHASKRHNTRKSRALRSKLSSIQNKKAQVRRELNRTKRKVAAVTSDIDVVDTRIAATSDALESTINDLASSRDRQRWLARQLRKSVDDLTRDREQVRKRLRGMYMEGDAPVISVFLGSDTSGDIASRQYLVERIAAADREALHNYEHSRNVVSKRKHEADRLVVRISNLASAQRSQESDLEDQRSEKTDILKDLQSRKRDLLEMLAQFESDERSIQAQILAAERSSSSHGGPPIKFTGRLMRPVSGPITSGFGMRYHPILHIRRIHAGIDFGAPRGTTIHAAGDGVVITAAYMRGFGNTVIIDHGGGIATVYGHCSRLMVTSGQHVHRGDAIAAVGSTGLATGPHLHFEVHVHGRAVNPLGWL